MLSTFRKALQVYLSNSVPLISSQHGKLDYSKRPRPILYGDEASPPVRFVLMTAAILNIKLDFHTIDLFNGEQTSEFYKKINPLQKVPAMKINDQIICDSNAIVLYLCHNNDLLYPTEPLLKARVDQMLFFNASALFPVDSTIFTEFFAGKEPIRDKNIEKWNFLMNYLDFHLADNKWLAGEKMLLCDLSCATTISSCRLLVPPLEQHKNINSWLRKLEEQPFYNDINTRGLQRLKTFVELRNHSI